MPIDFQLIHQREVSELDRDSEKLKKSVDFYYIGKRYIIISINTIILV